MTTCARDEGVLDNKLQAIHIDPRRELCMRGNHSMGMGIPFKTGITQCKSTVTVAYTNTCIFQCSLCFGKVEMNYACKR